jgi:hypothetical protein
MNLTLITDAYRRIHLELAVEQGVGADGIRPDGSFGYVPLGIIVTSCVLNESCRQHGGLLYNGNYGKD